MTKRNSTPARQQPPPPQPSRSSSRRWLPLALVAIILALGLGVIGGQAGWFSQPSGSTASPATGAGPRITWDETVYDFGQVPFNKQVEHSFVYRNTGDAPLTILERPTVETIVGC